MTRIFIVEVGDDPVHEGKTRVGLYRAQSVTYGEHLASTSVRTNKHVAIGARTVFATQYGNPNDKPPLRNRAIRHEPGHGTLCVSQDGNRLAWLPEDDYQGA